MSDILRAPSIKKSNRWKYTLFCRYSFVKTVSGMRERWLRSTQNTGELRSTRPKSLCHHDWHMSLSRLTWHARGRGRGRGIIVRLRLAWAAWSKSIHWATARVVCVGLPADASKPCWGASAIGRLQPIMVSYGAQRTSLSAFNCPPNLVS